ncbi:hypothetical protein FA15DRAFT_673855 [Coprinopsis marcescibilis]|uniref:DUF6699 domain-containing protein n=1 Tax=Coprinopsis marcescibilis TaxID=230819 RepID=A0A5C3KVW0_COPMA|nr:hypothetical protein FA15DRAFT_673855 [Coprinopsis marcescibilis]
MSGPYVYQPQVAFQPGPYAFNAPPSPFSPFVPDLSHLANSPYSRPASLQNSPNFATTALPTTGVPFPISNDNPFYRQRRPSWHGPAPTLDDGFLFAPPVGHVRSNSFGAQAAPQQPFYPPATAPIYNVNWNSAVNNPWNQPQQTAGVFIHPWLNGETPRKDFIFNLASVIFNPARMVGMNGQLMPLAAEELAQPATFPHIYELKIVHNKIPQWPVELSYQQPPTPFYSPAPTAGQGAPPITVGDVLYQLHQSFHQMITQAEWSELSSSEEREVTHAYRKRCKSMGVGVQGFWESQGVKRVDYLREKSWFRGLIRTGQSLNELRLITGTN